VIFSKANSGEAATILKCLNSYSKWLGQCIDFSKSTIFFNRNCKPAIKASINKPPIPAKVKYLGIPLFMDRKKDSFIELKDRILAKVTS
jgi:hypothetical protein